MEITFDTEDKGVLQYVNMRCFLNKWEIGQTRVLKNLSFDKDNVQQNIDLDLVITLSDFFNELRSGAKCK